MGNKASSRITDNEVEGLLNRMKRGSELVGETKNARITREILHCFNARDVSTMIGHCTDDAIFCYEGSEGGMMLDTFLLIGETMYASFPDVIITWEKIVEEAPGKVKVRGVRTRGTHTGKPYGFCQFPAVPTTNILVEENAEYTFYISKTGKCTKLVLTMVDEGDLIGPAGYYVKIGGKIDL